MSGGFWTGAVPPWAYVVWVCSCALFLLAGIWAGFGRGQAEAEEERRWAREQAKARRTHPVYRQPPELVHEEQFPGRPLFERAGTPWPYEDAWAAYKEALANDPILGGKLHDIHGGPGEDCWCGYVGHDPLEPTAVLTPQDMSWTGEIQRMTAAFQEDMARLLGGTDEQLKGITR